MSFYDRFAQLCEQNGLKPGRVASECGINRSNVTNWKHNGYTPRGDALQQIANYFGVSTDHLLGNSEETAESYEPTLNARDHRDIAKRLKETLDDLTNNTDGLMFDGEPLDEETKELLRISLQNQLEMTKLMAKKKYTPKKYQK